MQLGFLSVVGDSDPVSNAQDHQHQRSIYRGAEYLVMADLSFAGLVCYPVAEGLPYDVIVELPSGLKRIQVKSTAKVRSIDRSDNRRPVRLVSGYVFEGKSWQGGLARYDDRADFLALVALDRRLVLYTETKKIRRVVVGTERFTPEACQLSLEAMLRG